MLRIATVSDIPAMLEIYAPFVLNTTNSFEYTVPTQEAFTQRFLHYTETFPWLVWEENGQVLCDEALRKDIQPQSGFLY